jgi:hypothetical protein
MLLSINPLSGEVTMRGKFIGSKACNEVEGRSKHLVELENGEFSILYSEKEMEFDIGEEFNDDAGFFWSKTMGPLQISYFPIMSKEAAEEEFKK